MAFEKERQILRQHGASPAVCDELLAYNANAFDHSGLRSGMTFPLEDEPFIAAWEDYVREARDIGVLAALKSPLIHLNFPIQQGISSTESYQQAVTRGIVDDNALPRQDVALQQPEALALTLHQTIAGRIPVLVAGTRADFETLLRALTCKNEPASIPLSQGAAMIAGYNNWDRVRRLKAAFTERHGGLCMPAMWQQEFQRIRPQKHLYQDKLILLSRDYYSGVLPEDLGLEADEWRAKSLIIRREHECAHYLTKRILGSMRNNILDELIADYAGISEASGQFRADWLLTFMGLEAYPRYREGGRLQNYRGIPPLSDDAFMVMQTIVFHAAANLERLDHDHRRNAHDSRKMTRIALMALTHYRLEHLASPEMITAMNKERRVYENALLR